MNPTIVDRCTAIARSFGATKLVLFGSAAKSFDTAADVDFACDGIHGWDLFRFGAKLEEELGRSVDVVPLQSDDRFSQYVARTGRILYEAK
jgi:predicted nucleotidyltransferase